MVGFPSQERFRFTQQASALLTVPVAKFCVESTSRASSRTALPPTPEELLPARGLLGPAAIYTARPPGVQSTALLSKVTPPPQSKSSPALSSGTSQALLR